MNKNELVAQVADDSGLTKADSAKAVDAVFDTISATLKNGDDVRLIGFGTFAVSVRAAGERRHPATGKTIMVPETRVAKFKPGKSLKESLN